MIDGWRDIIQHCTGRGMLHKRCVAITDAIAACALVQGGAPRLLLASARLPAAPPSARDAMSAAPPPPRPPLAAGHFVTTPAAAARPDSRTPHSRGTARRARHRQLRLSLVGVVCNVHMHIPARQHGDPCKLSGTPQQPCDPRWYD